MSTAVTVGQTPAPVTSPIQHRTGGGIQNNIPRKNNKLPTATPGVNVFPQHTAGHDTILGFEGLGYNVTFTESDTPPLAGQFNNATLPQVPALQVTTPGKVVPLNNFTRINPNETSVLHTSGRPRPLVNRAGGPSPHTDTPFHPTKPKPAPVQRYRPTPQQLRTVHHINNTAGSFNPTGTSRGTLSQQAPHDLGTERWATIKVGAAG